MNTDHERVKSLLTEAVKLLCKSLITYRSEFSIEGLIGITVDRSEVVLVSICETVTADTVSVVQTAASSDCGAVETFAGATSVILVTPDTGTDITQLVEFGGLLQDDATEVVVEAAAQLSETANTASDIVTVEAGEIAGGSIATPAQAYATLETMQTTQILGDTAQIVGDTIPTQAQPYSELEHTPQSSLFTTAELDEFIVNYPSAGIISDSSCDVFAEVAITSESPPHSDKQLEAGSVEVSKEPLSAGSVADDGVPLLLPGDVDDAMPSCLSWDDDLSDIAPLNLAGPQDLSLQLDKKVLVQYLLFMI